MTDEELIKFCGLQDQPPELQKKFLRDLSPAKRELFDKMRAVEFWDQGIGPLPEGIIICKRHE